MFFRYVATVLYFIYHLCDIVDTQIVRGLYITFPSRFAVFSLSLVSLILSIFNHLQNFYCQSFVLLRKDRIADVASASLSVL